MPIRTSRNLLLGGASILALEVGFCLTPVHAVDQPPGLSLSIATGLACSFGDQGTFTADNPQPGFASIASARFAEDVCGWTGQIGLINEQPTGFFSNADYWGIFVRHTNFDEDRFSAQDDIIVPDGPKYNLSSVALEGNFDEERLVLDFEVGSDLGIGVANPALRAFVGLRYMHYESEINVAGTSFARRGIDTPTGGPFIFLGEHDYHGVGPRIGLTGQVPLAANVGLVFLGSASALWGRHEVDLSASGPFGSTWLSTSDHDWVFNVEGEASLVFALPVNDTRLFVGVRMEAWFDQSELNDISLNVINGNAAIGGDRLDRHNWGPFVRLTIPLTETP